MATRYVLSIDSVDGETSFNCATPRADVALSFLDQHNHEGATFELSVVDHPQPVTPTMIAAMQELKQSPRSPRYTDTEAYRFLEEAVLRG